MENEEINDAKKVLKTISQDERERRLTELREKYRMDQHAIMLAGYDKGLKEGIEQGIEQGFEQGKKQGEKEIAKKLFKLGISENEIEKVTELTKEELEIIKKEI